MTHTSYETHKTDSRELDKTEPIFWGEDIPYETGLTRQAAVHKLRVLGEIPDQFFYLTHLPVITYGRVTNPADIHHQPHEIPTIEVQRGGLATYHGPGQLIGYIIMDLKHRANNQPPDIHAYLRAIEDGLIDFVQSEYHLPACRREGFTGVWTHGFSSPNPEPGPRNPDPSIPRKLASIGVSARKWITSHGFALNLHPDMNSFRSIISCGITDSEMTSVQSEHERAGRPYAAAPLDQTAVRVHQHLTAALARNGW